jgi:hypothetical protein
MRVVNAPAVKCGRLGPRLGPHIGPLVVHFSQVLSKGWDGRERTEILWRGRVGAHRNSTEDPNDLAALLDTPDYGAQIRPTGRMWTFDPLARRITRREDAVHDRASASRNYTEDVKSLILPACQDLCLDVNPETSTDEP